MAAETSLRARLWVSVKNFANAMACRNASEDTEEITLTDLAFDETSAFFAKIKRLAEEQT